MFKKILASFLVFLCFLFMFPCAALAEDKHDFENGTSCGVDLSSFYGLPFVANEVECANGCGYYKYTWNFLGMTSSIINKGPLSPSEVWRKFTDWRLKTIGRDSQLKKIETAGGASGGRNPPSGYTSDGVPSVDSSGLLTWQPDFPSSSTDFVKINRVNHNYCSISEYTKSYGNVFCSVSGSHISLSVTPLSGRTTFQFEDISFYNLAFSAPVSGYYSSSSFLCSLQGRASNSSEVSKKRNYSYSGVYFNAGDLIYIPNLSSGYSYVTPTFYVNGYQPTYVHSDIYTPVFTITPLNTSVAKQTNITINNNNWTGNIYQDASTNLTYIYPQYTTINEAGDTVTNISNNPIIYNNTTNEYYTYDSTTNNYYYITYVTAPDPTATPAPSTSPDPGPTPGGGSSGGGSSGGSTSTPESGSGSSGGGQSWWSKLLDKLGNGIVDLLLDAISTVFNLILKLFSTILGWIIWFASKSLDLLPFLPPGLNALLVGGVVVIFVIYIIKFIRG